MQIRAVIFDVGGVLLHVRDTSRRRAWETRLSLAPGSLEEIIEGSEEAKHASSGHVQESDVWHAVGSKLGLAEQEILDLQSDFRDAERLDLELCRFVRELRPKYLVGVLSNAWSDARRFHNHRFRMNTWVDAAVYSAEEHLLKPDPEMYRIIAERLGVSERQCVFVDDVQKNVAAAEELGMKGVVCRSTTQTLADLRSYLSGA